MIGHREIAIHLAVMLVRAMFSACVGTHARNLRDGSRRNVVIVSVPPDILDYPTSTDMVVREGSNVTLRCAATGTPEPTVTWRRETGGTISLSNWHEGMYLCAIASSNVNWLYSVARFAIPDRVAVPFPFSRPLRPFSTPFRRCLASYRVY